jgi:predicted PurR-regulated permease PerM
MNDPAPLLPPPVASRMDWVAWGVAAAALLLVLKLGLLPALLAALLVFELVNLMVPRLRLRALGAEGPQLVAVVLIASAVIAGLSAVGIGIASFFRDGDSIPALFRNLAVSIERSRDQFPSWVLASLPDDAEELRLATIEWLREHGGSFGLAGAELGRALAHILIGMVVGALLSLHLARKTPSLGVIATGIYQRAARFSTAFRNVVFAQILISAINTTLTAIYLALILPAFDIHLPLVKTLIAVTFVAGLLPILGNLISNTVIFIVSLSQSLLIAVVSLLYLIVIHKLEYFLNARIIGSQIRARAWELLIAMLVMEAAFGVAGLIAAPIYYAYVKSELRDKELL